MGGHPQIMRLMVPIQILLCAAQFLAELLNFCMMVTLTRVVKENRDLTTPSHKHSRGHLHNRLDFRISQLIDLPSTYLRYRRP